MKTVKVLALAAMLMPVGAAFAADAPEQAKPENTALESCKMKADFAYHFDMMKIEGDEMSGKNTHDGAAMMKNTRQVQLEAEYADCEDQFKKN